MTMNGMFDKKPPPVTLDSMISCIKRELAMRNSVYPRQVKKGVMKQHSADNELRIMQGVLDCLTKLKTCGIECVGAEGGTDDASFAALATFNEAFKEYFGG